MHQYCLKIDVLEVQAKVVLQRGRAEERAIEKLFPIQFIGGH